MMASRKSPMAIAAPMIAARITPIDWMMTSIRTMPVEPGPEYQTQRIPTMRPPTRSPTPIFRLDFGDEIVLPEEWVELHDLLDLEQLIVHLVLLGGSGANEHEPDSHPWSPCRKTTDAI